MLPQHGFKLSFAATREDASCTNSLCHDTLLLERYWVTQGSADVALEKQQQQWPKRQFWRNATGHLCCPQNRMDRKNRETWWETREQAVLGFIQKKRNTCQRNKVSDPAVMLTNCIDFYLSLSSFSSPHISGDWQYIYIFFYIRFVRQFSKYIKLLWYTSKVKFVFVWWGLWVGLAPLLHWCYDRSQTHTGSENRPQNTRSVKHFSLVLKQ